MPRPVGVRHGSRFERQAAKLEPLYEEFCMPTPSVAPTTPKQQAQALINQLPDDATWQDVAEALAVIADIEAGLAESDAGLGVDTETLRKRFGLHE